MSHNSTVTEQLLRAGLQLEDVLDYLDELHTSISEGNESVDDRETLSVLRDIIYTASEAMREIEAKQAARKRESNKRRQPILQIVEKIDKAG